MNIKKSLEIGKAALKELVAQTEGKFFSVKYDHFSMQDARAAIRRLDETIEYLEKQYPFGVYGAEDLDKTWKSGYDNCKAQRTWVGLTKADRKEIEMQSVYVEGSIRMTEAKLKQKNGFAEKKDDPLQPEENNFCSRCGKRLGKSDWDIHTCTPPQD